jgi:hypothetical protein
MRILVILAVIAVLVLGFGYSLSIRVDRGKCAAKNARQAYELEK